MKMSFTRSQAAAYRRLLAIAKAQFCPVDQTNFLLTPRLRPLLIGPTGVGKTALARAVAEECSAAFFRTSIGEWTPAGAKAPATLDRLRTVLRSNTRAVVLIDEIDKTRATEITPWLQSIIAEVFCLLDGDAIRAAEGEKLATFLIVAAGTWQWTARENASRIGFGAGGANSSGSGKWTARVRDNPLIPPELLFRFCWPPLELSYPLADETAELYERFGLKRLAANVGETLDPETHDWATGGLRSLENLAASLLIRAHENDSSQSQ